MIKKKMVYVAGPISKGPYWINVRNGLDAGKKLNDLGMIPFIPMMDFLYVLLYPETTWEQALQYDEQIILRCDALLRLPGESLGADREIKFANENGIPVFYDIESLHEWNTLNAQESIERCDRPNCCRYN